LGFKFVHGTQPHLYIERLDRKALRKLGLSLEVADHQADVFVRVPKNPEAVFRAAVERDGVPATDILQVWLDVSNHPARGKVKPIFSVSEYFPKLLIRPMHECESRVCVLREARGIFDALARPGGHHWGLGAPPTPIASFSPTTAIRALGNA
jgi:hypothetical protein